MKHQALVPDDLWEAIAPLLLEEPPKATGGRPRVPDRATLGGIVVVLRSGCPWRRLRDWQEAGVWERLHERRRTWLGDEAALDWRRASTDSVRVRAKRE